MPLELLPAVTLKLKGPTAELDELSSDQMTLLLLPSAEKDEQLLEFAPDSPFFQLSHSGSKSINLMEVDPPQILLIPNKE